MSHKNVAKTFIRGSTNEGARDNVAQEQQKRHIIPELWLSRSKISGEERHSSRNPYEIRVKAENPSFLDLPPAVLFT